MSEIKESPLGAEEQNRRAEEEAVKFMRSIEFMEQNRKSGLVPGSEFRFEVDESVPEDDRLFNFDKDSDWQNPKMSDEDKIRSQALQIVCHNLGMWVLEFPPHSVVGAQKATEKTGDPENVRNVQWSLQSPTHPYIQLITTDTRFQTGRRELKRGLYCVPGIKLKGLPQAAESSL